MRVIGPKVINEMVVADPMSGDQLILYYRSPTTEERQQYVSDLFLQEDGKVKDNTQIARLKWGLELLTGIGDQTLALTIDGETRPVHNNPESEHYRADWKELMREYAADLPVFLALRVFEALRQIPKPAGSYDRKN